MRAKTFHVMSVLFSFFWLVIVMIQLCMGVYFKDNEMIGTATKVLMALLLPSVVPTAAGIVARNTPNGQDSITHAQS